MEMFYYPNEQHMLVPIDHMRARILLTQKLKERAATLVDSDFAIWSSKFTSCQKFTCVEDLDNFAAYIAQYDMPRATPQKRRFR